MTLLPFNSIKADLQTAGGKGANLARLAQAGFQVPDGFIISTAAYQDFVESNHLLEVIEKAILAQVGEQASDFEATAVTIRKAFSAGKMQADFESSLRQAYARFNHRPVAVRSSATAEDLPDLSFAGQQETYLNVVGQDQLLQAVISCWSSLWTARAIGYRRRNGISHTGLSLAVVVQEMVQSEISGVLFTANPLTGLLSESVIEATYGLGEALVSGQVEPDRYVVDTTSREISAFTPGSKEFLTRSKVGGGVETIPQDAAGKRTLSEHNIDQLIQLGQQVQQEFGAPQDIEWAFANGNLYLLQSRPITSLYPVPEVSYDPLIIWFSFSAVQGLVRPMTPLGQDLALNLVANGGKLFGVKISPQEQRLFARAGERLWIRITDLLRNPLGSRMYREMLNYIEPSVGQILSKLAEDPRVGAGQGRIKVRTLLRVFRFFFPVTVRLAGNFLRPDGVRPRFDAAITMYLASAKIPPAEDRFGRLANIAYFLRHHVAEAFQFLLPRFIPAFGPSMGALNLLNQIAGEDRSLALAVTRGLPNNVTTEMDLALWETAKTIRADNTSELIFQEEEAARLAGWFLEGSLPAPAQQAVAAFMKMYGMRGVSEIDIGQPRWREDPTPLMLNLKSYLTIKPEQAPDVLFARGEKAAMEAIEELAAIARKQPGGWFKEKLVRAAARRIRLLMGARESPKLFAIRNMGIARSAILEVGQEFVEVGTLERPDDLVYLTIAELLSLSRQEPRDWKRLVLERRAIYAREVRRRQVPRVLVSDGRFFLEGVGAKTDSGDILTGSPVSPGQVEGFVRVVLDPHHTQLSPGEILVCPGTDPAWTPLFMAAGGLVTEVGGMMTHGSVVAREYGLPAVVGVHQATMRLKDGQRIRLNGTTGEIAILER